MICLILFLICSIAFSLTFFSSRCFNKSLVWSCWDLYLSIFRLRMLICSFTISYLLVNFVNLPSIYSVLEVYWSEIKESFYRITFDNYLPRGVYTTVGIFFVPFYFILAYSSYILPRNIWISDRSSTMVPFLWSLLLIFFFEDEDDLVLLRMGNFYPVMVIF